MAGPNINYHTPILSIKNRSNTAPYTDGKAEKAAQTFKNGTPVQMDVTGFVKAWDGATTAAGILGVSESFGLNLASNGLGAPGIPFGQVAAPAAIQTYGYVINEPNAVNIALGTPISDGRTLFIYAENENIFEAIFDNSTGTVAANYTPTQAMINTTAGQLGLTVDTNGFWYVDAAKTGGSAVLQVIGVNPLDGLIVNARVQFQFLQTAIQNQ